MLLVAGSTGLLGREICRRPLTHAKRTVEERLRESGMAHTILRQFPRRLRTVRQYAR